jgi:predicted nucleic acid-binding protein
MIFLDTNVISETMRPRPDPVVFGWLEHNSTRLSASTVVLAEVRFGIMRVAERQRSPRWSMALEAWKDQLKGRIHAFDSACADLYGDIMGRAHLAGRPMQPLDGMIAAIALRHGAALATRNTKHFEGLGLRLMNPFEPAP